ncbi:MAG: hypothetical protein IPH61_05800 [Bacteroidetes bacterium]|nr:hypothetical protein [Bacteroidota bacterium]
METNTNIFQKVIQHISQQTDIETDENKIAEIITEEQALHALTQIIIFLIDTNFEKLLWILYRIDVNEAKLKRVLKENSPVDAPSIIAQMIIDREKQKEKYKSEFKTNLMKQMIYYCNALLKLDLLILYKLTRLHYSFICKNSIRINSGGKL